MAAESSRYYDMLKIARAQRAARPLPLQMLQDITKNFSEERVLGQGGFGVVYKGVLHNGEAIAIKKFLSFPRGNNEEQLKKEVAHLMGLEHKNIVGLVGYCNNIQRILVDIEGTLRFADQQETFLCLEFLPRGSLDKHISDACRGLDWQMRCKIIMGVCHGLHYLHENRIIHMDLKPANILLDNDMMPKITDFGLSRVIGPEQTRIYTSTCVGTRGYMAPEYLEKGIISIKSDVFSIGVVIIEIIVGHRNYPDGTEMSMQNFVEHVLQNWRNRLEKLRCASLEKDCQQIKVCIEIGLRCVHTDAAKRPTTGEIIECLRTNFHVSNKEETPADQVQQKQANIPEAARNTSSLERRSRMRERCLETDPNCMEMDLVKRPATMGSVKRLNEPRILADQAMTAPEMRYRPRHVNNDQLQWMDSRLHGRICVPSGYILMVVFF